MKIALVNYRYFFTGGPERYLFNIKELLEDAGHDVYPFSVKSQKNVPNDYEKYFLDAIDDKVYFAQSKKTFSSVIRYFFRMFYSFEARKKFYRFLKDIRPDIVYMIQYHNKISPSIVFAAKKLKIPVVHRISDFQYICPNALLYNDNNGICEDCLHGQAWHCVKYKCIMNSSVYSVIKLAAKKFHEMLGVTKKIDAFVVPSAFTLNKFVQYGIPPEKLFHIPTFFNLKDSAISVTYEPYILFVGRIEKHKGVMTLIKAFENTAHKLLIIGFSNGEYENELKSFLSNKNHHIEFHGKMDFHELVPYLLSCLCTIVPSEWYDNFPNTIIESFACKKAVIATDTGSLPELVKDHHTGLTFRYGSPDDLKKKVAYMFSHPDEAKRMGENAHQTLLRDYSKENHYTRLMNVFSNVQRI